MQLMLEVLIGNSYTMVAMITTLRPEGVVIDDKSWQPWYKCYISYLIG